MSVSLKSSFSGQMIHTCIPVLTVRSGYLPGSTGSTVSYSPPKYKCFVLTHDRTSFDMFLALGVDDEREHTDFIFVEKVEDIDEGSYGGRIRLLNDFFLNPNLDSILKFLDKQLDYTKRRGNAVNFSISGYVGGGTSFPSSVLSVSSSGNVGIGTITP